MHIHYRQFKSFHHKFLKYGNTLSFQNSEPLNMHVLRAKNDTIHKIPFSSNTILLGTVNRKKRIFERNRAAKILEFSMKHLQ